MSIKNEIQPIKRESEESTDQDSEEYACSTTHTSSANTFIKYEVEETLDIKEEIIQDNEVQMSEEHNLLPERNQLNERCITTKNFSANDSGAMRTIKYDTDDESYIKEEINLDQGLTVQKCTKKYEEKFCTVDRKKTDESVVNNEQRTHQMKKNCESRPKPEKIYKCEKCARSYKSRTTLNRHKKFSCDVIPKFSCKFCGKRFQLKCTMNRHVDVVHLKLNLKISKIRHHCDKCSRSYVLLESLNNHKRAEHIAVKPKFTCDICGHKTKWKHHLSKHISLHLQTSKLRHYCDKCSRSYAQLEYLNRHKRLDHAEVNPEFTCDICGHKTKRKSNLLEHITIRHLQTLNTRHHCTKCFKSYNILSSLKYHERREHAAGKPQFTCDFCGHTTNVKSSLSRHITLLHSQKAKTRYDCDKCSRSYTVLDSLNKHKKVEHAALIPEFTCDICRHKTKRKRNLVDHIKVRHLQTSKMRHYCDKCPLSYTRIYYLNNHKRLKHAADKS